MTNRQFTLFINRLVEAIRSVSPIDTGNLRYNAIRFEFLDENTCRIYVDEAIAPYMPYTTEPWVSPKWHGKKNPNEGWWQIKATEAVKTAIREILNDRIDKEYDRGQSTR